MEVDRGNEEIDDRILDISSLPTVRRHFRSKSDYSSPREESNETRTINLRKESSSSSLDSKLLFQNISPEVIARSKVDGNGIELPPRRKTDCILSAESFQCESLIGKGNIGFVFKVSLKEDSGQVYAAKVLSKVNLVQRKKEKRALVELTALSILNHPFIARLYHCFQDAYCIYFIIQHYKNGELIDLMKSNSEQFKNECIIKFYSGEVLIALEYLHSKGFIYRDLKPENILISDTGHVVLADFDMSKKVPNEFQMFQGEKKSFLGIPLSLSRTSLNSSKQSLYRTHSIIGTNEYIAPEVLYGNGHSGSVDWWAFGILLYEMRYNISPFHSISSEEIYQNILYKDVVFPKSEVVSEEFKAMIKKLLAKNPMKRMGSSYGAVELKTHSFFSDTKWDELPFSTPPIQPRQKSQILEQGFEGKTLSKVIAENFTPFRLEEENQVSPFLDFNFIIRYSNGVLAQERYFVMF